MLRKRVGRVALMYAALVLVVGCLTAAFDIAHLHDQREHLLPDAVLVVVTLPASLLLGLFPSLSIVFRSEIAQVAFFMLGGLVQAGCVWSMTRRAVSKPPAA